MEQKQVAPPTQEEKQEKQQLPIPEAEKEKDPLWDAEELVPLPKAERRKDPLWGVKIKRMIDGVEFIGQVVAVGIGVITKERLYCIKYMDTDLELYTADMAEKYRVKTAKKRPAPAAAAAE